MTGAEENDMSQPPGKKSRRELQQQEDRISDLHDDILFTILSLLPTIQVMKMSTLARRWRYVWTLLPDINFTLQYSHLLSPNYRELHLTLFNQITFALMFHRRQKLSRFIISLDGAIVLNPSHVYAWCRFAVERAADELQLNIITGKYFTLPTSLYNHRQLKSLFIRNCETKLTGNPVCWPVLRSLKLRDSKLGDGAFEAILHGCPLLECLILDNVIGGSTSGSLISAPSLRVLAVMDTSLPVRLWTPNLMSLKISGSSNRLLHTIKDMHSLERASFSISMPHGGYQQGWGSSTGKCLSGLLDSVCRAPFLTICRCCIEIFSAREINKLPSPILDTRSLVLKTSFSDSEIPGIRNLLRCSPDLETLSIEINIKSLCSKRGAFKMQKGFDGCPYLQPEEYALLSIKSVEIHEIIDICEGYQNLVSDLLGPDGVLHCSQKAYAKSVNKRSTVCSKFRRHMFYAMHFIKFLLGSSVILEKLTIWLPKKLLSAVNSWYKSFFNIIDFINSFPRANGTKVICDFK